MSHRGFRGTTTPRTHEVSVRVLAVVEGPDIEVTFGTFQCGRCAKWHFGYYKDNDETTDADNGYLTEADATVACLIALFNFVNAGGPAFAGTARIRFVEPRMV